MQKKEETKGFIKKLLGRFLDSEWSDGKIKEELALYHEEVLIQGLEEGKFNPNRLLFGKLPIFNEAVERDLFDFVRKLIQKGVDVNQQDGNGKTAVMCLVDGWWNAQNRKFWPLLKKAGVDFNKPDNEGKSPLLRLFGELKKDASIPVFQADRFDCLSYQIEYLLKFGADINFKDKEGQTALHQVVFAESYSAVRFLVKNKADLNAQDNEGNTPLHYAVRLGLFKIAQCLITKEIDLLKKNKEGEDAYNFAMKEGEREIAELITKELLRRKKEERAAQKKLEKSGSSSKISSQTSYLKKMLAETTKRSHIK